MTDITQSYDPTAQADSRELMQKVKPQIDGARKEGYDTGYAKGVAEAPKPVGDVRVSSYEGCGSFEVSFSPNLYTSDTLTPNLISIGISPNDSYSYVYPQVTISLPRIKTCEGVPVDYSGSVRTMFTLDLENCEDVADGAFNGVHGVNYSPWSGADLPLRRIGDHAFAGISELYIADLKNCEELGCGAFEGSIMQGSISLPKCLTIPEGAFESFTGSSIFADSCTSIRDRAFCDCEVWNNELSFGECTSVGEGAFQYYGGHEGEDNRPGPLTQIYLPKCTQIGADAFRGLSALYSLDLSSLPLRDIKEGAYAWGLDSVDLPENCTVWYLGEDGAPTTTTLDTILND